MRWLLAAVILAWPQGLQAQDPPPAYPRPGATKVLENDRVIVWHIAWLQQEYPLHRHRYDHVGVYYSPGDRIITSPEGEKRPISTPAWNLSFQPRGVTHVEQGASEEPLRAVFVQIKDEPKSSAGPSGGPPAFPVDDPVQRLDNERTTVWEYDSGSAATVQALHRHMHDAVVVTFNDMNEPDVRYVERGTAHDSDLPAGSSRAFVFEIK
jgi:hypothetical protein